MLTLNDGRSELWQWDTGRTLAVDADCSQVHFSNKVFGRSIDVDVVDGVAIIPDILLQTDKDLNVWAFVGTAENGYTKISKTFKVNRRNKPADYVFTPTDQMTLQTIQSQIGDLADLTTEAKNNLVAAINEAAQSGGGGDSTVELDTTLTQSGKAADAKAVGDALVEKQPVGDYLTQNELQAATDAALAQAKASGEFDGPRGPAGAPGKDGAGMDVTGATVGQIAKIAAVDASGVPTAWEPADMPSGGGGGEWVFAGSVTAASAGMVLMVSNIHAKHILVSLYASCDDDSNKSYSIRLNDTINYLRPGCLTKNGEKHLWAVEFELLTGGDENYIYCRVIPDESHHTSKSNDLVSNLYTTSVQGTMWYKVNISEFNSVAFLCSNGTSSAGNIMNVWYR